MIVHRIINRYASGWTPQGNRYKRIELTYEQLAQALKDLSGLHVPHGAFDRLHIIGLPADCRRFEHLLCKTCGAPVEPHEEACSYCLSHTGAMILLGTEPADADA